MKIFFDTEFTGLHRETNLISIGLIDENGRSFYAEFDDFVESNKKYIDKWLIENVINNLIFIKLNNIEYRANHLNNCDVLTDNRINYIENGVYVGENKYIKDKLLEWLSIYETIEWVSDVSHYDFVLLIDLLYKHALNMIYGKVNASCHDINQDIARYYNINEIEAFNKSREDILSEHNILIEGIKHNAMYDARVIRELYKILNGGLLNGA